MAAMYGTTKRKLEARTAVHSGKAKFQKTALCHEHGLPVRRFNAMIIELHGPIDCTRELL